MAQHGTATCTEVPRAEAIARLNDQLRKTGTGGTIMITSGVQNLTGFRSATLCAALAAYDEFDRENDPHGERDFGDITLFGVNLLFKIDYYDKNLQFASDDPADPAVTQRVLTVMLASDW
jgi:hypothetical protein